MNYHDGSKVALGDRVAIPVPGGKAAAQVVMLGDSREHLSLDPQFLEWVTSSNALQATSVVVEWIGRNPFAHDEPAFAPVGNYMFTVVDESVDLQARAEA